MKKTAKLLALVLALVLVLSAFSACGQTGSSGSTAAPSSAGSGTASGPDISKEVTLTMYLIGDRPVDNDLVFEKINERLKEEINATIDVKFMSWSEYEQKYPLIFASGEDWDIIFTADWCFYNAQATKQGFWEITQEALETYAPMTATGGSRPRGGRNRSQAPLCPPRNRWSSTLGNPSLPSALLLAGGWTKPAAPFTNGRRPRPATPI